LLRALRSFDIMSLAPQYRQYVATHGKSLFDRGMSVEEIWASQQLYSAKPMVLILAETFASQPHARVDPKFITTSQSMVWLLAAMCMRFNVTSLGINVLVSDGRTGHTISLTGLNGVAFTHPRGTAVQAGWFSFHDSWPARSLLAPEHGYPVMVLEDITRPPFWLIAPQDLDKIVVGFLISVDLCRR
jgi:hypothetical protein